MDRRLGRLEKWRLGAHLKVCEGCRNFQNQVSFLRRAFRNHPVMKDRWDKSKAMRRIFARQHPKAPPPRTCLCGMYRRP